MDKEEIFAVAALVERNNARLRNQEAIYKTKYADYERQLTEHRASFGARTEADAKIIAGLREERDRWKSAFYDQSALLGVINAALGIHAGDDVCGEIDRLHKERDGLLTQVQDMRAALAKEQELHAATALRLSTEAAKLVERKHPVKVGEWVRRTERGAHFGHVAQVVNFIEPNYYEVQRADVRSFWFFTNCEPCDPPEATHAEPDLTQLHAKGKEAWSDVPNATQWVEEMRGNTEATHDTEAGKAAAEAAVKIEPVAEEIKVGDVVEVFQATCTRWTSGSDVGLVGPVVRQIVREGIPTVTIAMHTDQETVALRDVRKVTT